MTDAKQLKILGLSFFYHDSAAALIIGGKPVAMSEEERFSRKKHDSDFPKLASEFVLKFAGINASDLDYVVFYEKPFLKFDRIIKTDLATFPLAPRVFAESLKHTFLDKLWIRAIIAKKLKIPASKILFSEHHLSHAAASFYCSPFDEAATVTIDGVGEWAVTTIGRGKKDKIEISKEIHFPHSIGLLYSAFTAFLGFEVNEGEFKVMGMAPYGKPKYADKVRKLINFYPDGSYSLNLEYFSFHKSLSRTYSKKFLEIFGKSRDPKSHFFTRNTGWPSYFGSKPEGSQFEKQAQEQEYYADVAASLQQVTEEAIIHVCNAAHKITGLDKLCLGGGVALNSVANWKITQQTPFKEIYVQPAAGDAGGALGASLVAHYAVSHDQTHHVMDRADFGQGFDNDEIKDFLEKNNIKYEYVTDDDRLFEQVASEIASGKVIGWFNGRFEWGPRALGFRSILADPRSHEMKDIVNTKIKFREPYRPFAPSVLAEHVEEFFEIPESTKHYPARFMLYVVDVKKDKQQKIPAITHVDGTGRLQMVYKDTNPRYWQLINKFYEKTGVPLVLNTSFNLKGEPIVTTPADAFSTFSRSGIDLLVLGNFLVYK
jgi:carbamoyltransferase